MKKGHYLYVKNTDGKEGMKRIKVQDNIGKIQEKTWARKVEKWEEEFDEDMEKRRIKFFGKS